MDAPSFPVNPDGPVPVNSDGTPPPAGLPGASLEAGTGPVVPALIEGLIEDTAMLGATGRPLAQAVRDHLVYRAAWPAPLVGSLVLPAAAVGGLSAALDAAAVPTSTSAADRLAVLLVVTAPPEVAAAAAGLDARVRPAGVELAAEAGDAGGLSEPVWIEIPRGPGMESALARGTAGGRQNVVFDIEGSAPAGYPLGAGDGELAAFLRRAIDLDLAFRLRIGPGRAVRPAGTGPGQHGLLNVLCAVRAALNGAETAELADVLAEHRAEPLASAVRRISDADAAVVRAFCHSVGCAAVPAVLSGLDALGLLRTPGERAL